MLAQKFFLDDIFHRSECSWDLLTKGEDGKIYCFHVSFQQQRLTVTLVERCRGSRDTLKREAILFLRYLEQDTLTTEEMKELIPIEV